jgi:hypothetical protein
VTVSNFLGAIALLAAGSAAFGADDRFVKEKPGSMNGFMVVENQTYLKECGACHFAYLPGLMPARNWEAVMTSLDKHFGENVQLPEPTRAALARYLTDNAADRSPYEGSKWLNENIPAGRTTRRLTAIPFIAFKHTVVMEAIARNFSITVRKLTNCQQCHTEIENGSIGIMELYIPGLTKANIIKEPQPPKDAEGETKSRK